MNSYSLIAKRYAKAYFNSSSNKSEQLTELKIISKILSNQTDVIAFFSSRIIDNSIKIEFIQKAFNERGISLVSLNFLLVLAKRGRISHIKEILLAYEELVDNENGIIRGTVCSAEKLDINSRNVIEKLVSSFIKKNVILTYSEDSNLVGGVIAQVAGWTFEDTLNSHLKRLKEDLNRRAI